MRDAAKTWIPLATVIVLVGAVVLYGPTLAGRVAAEIAKGEHEAARAQLVELSKQDRLSVLFRAVAKAVRPAVVEVRVTKKIRGGAPFGPDSTEDWEEFFKRYFGDNPPFNFRWRTPPPRDFVQRGLGSGVIVDAAKGIVLTNWHVVRATDSVEVVLADKRSFEAEWIRTDPATDLAIIKIKPEGLVEAPLGDSDKLEIGDWVLAIGAPRGLPQTVTAGIVSAKGRQSGMGATYQDFIQTDAAINQGNSGGPLVNTRGEVIGINTAIVSSAGGNEGIGFAIPANMAREVMDQLLDKGEVTRGYLGVRIQDVDAELAKSFGLPADAKGALIPEVVPGGPGDEAGLKPGDFIVAVGGQDVTSAQDVLLAVARLKPGSEVAVEIYREGKKMTRTVKIGTRPKDLAGVWEDEGGGPAAPDASERFGIKVADATEELAKQFGYKEPVKGVLITEVRGDSDAAGKGVMPGMLIKQAQGKDVSTVAEFAKAISGKDAERGVRLLVQTPRGGQMFVFITPAK